MNIKDIEIKHGRKPPCIYYRNCGGCQLQHITDEGQSIYKQRYIENLFKEYKVNNILSMEDPYFYRNKIHSTFAGGKKGEVIAGFYQANTHNVTDIEKCIIQDSKADEIIKTIKKLMKSFKMKPFNEDTKDGFLRHVLIKKGFKTDEIMVVLVVSTKIFPGKNNYIKALLKEHPEIKTIILNVNNRKTSVVLGEEEHVIYGKGYIEDILCGVKFQISAKSFYQVNPIQTEVLYNKAIEMANLTGKERIIDAYCGIGTIGLIMSSSVKEVIGVEVNKDAVKDAIKNAKLNNIKNAYFYNDDAGDFMVKLANENKKIDMVMMDPPRAGSDEKFLSSLVKLSPEKIVYISCNPETQKRDELYLIKHGYKVKEIQPVDMFPQTEHVETVVLLSHKKADTHINVNVEFGEGEGKIPVGKIVKKAEDQRPSERVTYKTIQEYIEGKYGFKVHTSYIAEVKRDLGLPMHDAPNAVEELKQPRKHPTTEKVNAIKDALKHFM